MTSWRPVYALDRAVRTRSGQLPRVNTFRMAQFQSSTHSCRPSTQPGTPFPKNLSLNSLYDGRMQRWHRLLTVGFAATVCLFAQGGTGIDNEQARGVIVTDQPHSKGGRHEHTREGDKKTTLPWRPRDGKWSPASGMHPSEVASDAPVTIVQNEVK